MNTSHVGACPDHDGGWNIGPGGSQSHLLHEQDERDTGRCHSETYDADPGRIEDGDYQNGAEVVDHGQREKQKSQGRGNPLPEQRQDAYGEGDVRGHRDPPAGRGVGRAGVEPEIDGRGHHHPPERRDDRKSGRADLPELSAVDLVLDLETDHEEEDDHQGIAYPEMKVMLERDATDPQSDRCLQECLVGRLPRRICPDQREDRCCEQHDTAGGLYRKEPLDRGK